MKKKKLTQKDYTLRARLLRKVDYKVDARRKDNRGTINRLYKKNAAYLADPSFRYIKTKKLGGISSRQQFKKGAFIKLPKGSTGLRITKDAYTYTLGAIKFKVLLIDEKKLAGSPGAYADELKNKYGTIRKKVGGKYVTQTAKKFIIQSNGHDGGGRYDISDLNNYLIRELADISAKTGGSTVFTIKFLFY